jgi:hypothetical protein
LAGSEELTPPNEQGGVVARSYGVPNTTAEDVLAFYEEQLAEVEVIEAPLPIGRNTFRGLWQLSDGRVLTVSATRSALQGTEDLPEDELVTQYSPQLVTGRALVRAPWSHLSRPRWCFRPRQRQCRLSRNCSVGE